MCYVAQAYSDELHKPSHPFDDIQPQLFKHFFNGQQALQEFLHDVTQMDEYYSMLSIHNNSEGGSVHEWRLQTKSIGLIQDMMVSYGTSSIALLHLRKDICPDLCS